MGTNLGYSLREVLGVDGLDHDGRSRGVGLVVVWCPAVEFHVHRDDGDQHEQHGEQQHHGEDAWWLLGRLIR